MLFNSLKFALRSLRKNNLFTTINVFGLTIGMAATLLIYVWVQNEWTFDAFYKDADQINRVFCHWNGGGDRIYINAIPISLRDKAVEKIPEIEKLYLLRPNFQRPRITNKKGNVFEERKQAYINEGWLETFDYQLVAGSIEAFENDKYSVALTETNAKKYFGNQSAIGQTLRINDTNYQVALVVEDRPSNSSFYYEMYLPLKASWKDQAAYEKDYRDGNYTYLAFFKSNQQIDQEKIAGQLADLLNEEDDKSKNGCSVVPISEMRFNKDLKSDYFSHQNEATVYIFAIIGLLMLLAAGLNYVNLSTALISKNTQNFGVRKVVGANFRHIFTQTMLETVLMSVSAFSLAIVIVKLSLSALSDFLGMALELNLGMASIWIGLLATISLSILIAGIYPALMSARSKPIQLLNDKNKRQKGGSVRNVLVITQFTVSIAVLISTLAIYQQLHYIQKKDVGYDRSKVIMINPRLWQGENTENNFSQFVAYKGELEKLAGFESVALTDGSLADIHNQNSGSLDWEGKPKEQSINVHQFRANEDLQKVFNLKMQRGRWFSEEMTSDHNNIILNETAVKIFNIPEPVIGRQSTFQRRTGQIVGVVKDFNFSSLHKEISPLVIWNIRDGGSKILARIRSDDTQAVMAQAADIFHEFIPSVEFEYAFIDETFQQLHEADARISTLFQIFAGILLFISCLGLLGLAVFAAEQRVKEIGIRKVLGASVINIVGLLSKNFLKLLFLALVIASPIAYYFMQTWLENFAYRIEMQWWFFALAGVVVITIALLTVSFQSIRAALTNPINSLRDE